MEITLNHTIIFTHNNVDTAKFYERVFGFEFVKKWGSFAVVKVNSTLGSTPFAPENGQINHNNGGRGVFFKDLNGHLFEIITQDYNLDIQP